MKRLDSDDWKILFNHKKIKIGKTEIKIKPVNITDAAEIAIALADIWDQLRAVKVTFANYKNPDKLQKIFSVISQKPGIAEKLTGLYYDDLKKLPVPVVLELADAVCDVNLTSYGGLEKNLFRAAEVMRLGIPLLCQMRYSFSSQAGTDGEKSKITPGEK